MLTHHSGIMFMHMQTYWHTCTCMAHVCCKYKR